VLAGAEVRIDERLGRLFEQDKIMTLADAGHYLILELPSESCIGLVPVWNQLAALGVSVILAHPERSEWLWPNPEAVLPWVESGLILQITASSLLGDFGPRAQEVSWHLLTTGAVSLVGSDAHDASTRPPHMSSARAAISSQMGSALARRVCQANPSRVLHGLPIGSPLNSETVCQYDTCADLGGEI
jgi:protein-tyrosine phosphatase